MKRPICTKCKERECEKFGGKRIGYRKLCYKCRREKGGKEKFLNYLRELTIRIKREVINAYGGKCVCCGENELFFLTIDHINNNGAEERRTKNIRGGLRTYRYLKKENFPKGYQVLCWNCNSGKHLNKGICPHKNFKNAS